MTRAGIPKEDARRLYRDLAWTWPVVSPPEDYVGEAEEFRNLIEEQTRFRPETLLDLGCGGGHIDATLKRHFHVTGVDVSEAMMDLARRLNPEVRYVRGDMRTVRLGNTFDAVVIADSIGYMLTKDDLRAAFRTAFEHLRPGGVLVTYAESTRENFRPDMAEVTVRSRGDVTIAFVEYSYDPDPDDAVFDTTFVYLIRRGADVTVEVDRHRNGLFPLEVWRRALRFSGFEVVEVSRGFGESLAAVPAFVGIRPGSRAGLFATQSRTEGNHLFSGRSNGIRRGVRHGTRRLLEER